MVARLRPAGVEPRSEVAFQPRRRLDRLAEQPRRLTGRCREPCRRLGRDPASPEVRDFSERGLGGCGS